MTDLRPSADAVAGVEIAQTIGSTPNAAVCSSSAATGIVGPLSRLDRMESDAGSVRKGWVKLKRCASAIPRRGGSLGDRLHTTQRSLAERGLHALRCVISRALW